MVHMFVERLTNCIVPEKIQNLIIIKSAYNMAHTAEDPPDYQTPNHILYLHGGGLKTIRVKYRTAAK